MTLDHVVNEPQTVAKTNDPSQGIDGQGGEGQKPEDIEFGKRFAALSRREKLLLQKEKELSEKFKPDPEKEAELKSYLEKKALVKDGKLDAILEAYGINYQQLTEYMLQKDEPLTAEKRVELLEKKLEQEKKDREDSEERKRQEEIEEAKEHIKRGINHHLESNQDKYELINFHQSQDLVYDVMAEYFQLEGKPLSYEAACGEVEKYHEETFKKAAALKKFQTPPEKEESFSPKDTYPAQPRYETRHVKTLTNENVASAAPIEKKPFLSDEESKRRSARLLEELWAKQKSAAK